MRHFALTAILAAAVFAAGAVAAEPPKPEAKPAPAPAPAPATPPAPETPKTPPAANALSAPAAPAVAAVRLTVEDCVLIALRNNVDLRRAFLADRQSELDRLTALAEFLPSLSASGSRSITGVDQDADSATTEGSVALTQKTPLGTTITGRASQSHSTTEGGLDNNSSAVSAELRQPLLAGAGTAAGLYDYRAADLGRLASAAELQRQRQSTVFQVRQLYWNALQNQVSVQASRRSLESADYFLKASQARLDAGQASKLDVSNAEIQRESRAVGVLRAEDDFETSLDELKLALDLSHPLDEKVELSSPARYVPARRDPEKLQRTAKERRPDLAAVRTRLAVQRLDVERKRRNAWPTLDLVASHSLSGAGASSDEGHTYDSHTDSVGLELSVPFGLVGVRAARQRAELEFQRAELDLLRREKSVEAELRRVLRQLSTAEASAASYEKRLAAARLSAAAARALYERGKATSFDVVRAEDDLLAAELGLAAAQADCLTRAAELELAAGLPVEDPPPAPATPAGKGK